MIGNSDDLDPGLVGHALRRRGYQCEEWIRERHHTWPHRAAGQSAGEEGRNGLDGIDVIVSLGSGWSTYWEEVADAVRAEQHLLRDACTASIPVLGICFGAQQLATALGGTVSRAPQAEIGWHEVRAVAESLTSQFESIRRGALACSGSWMQWHYDRFTVPPGATLLAESPVGAQAFVIGRALGVQFHPEATESIVREWSSATGRDELVAARIDPESLREATRTAMDEAISRCDQLVEWFCRDIAVSSAHT